MFFFDTIVEKRTNTFDDLFKSIDSKIYQYGKIVLNNRKYGFDKKINHQAFDDLTNYRDILKMKLECDECLCEYCLDDIISKINKLTITIC